MITADKIRIAMIKNERITQTELAKRINTTPQNLNNKMSRNNFSEKDLQNIANALNCELEINFINKGTKEKI